MSNKESLFSRLFKRRVVGQPVSSEHEPQPKAKPAPGYASYTAPVEALDMGNKVFNKDYQGAIDEGLKALEEAPDDPMLHINLMDAYSKGRNLNPEYLDLSTYHAKQAMLCGHHTGLAEYRLAINLEKKKLYHQSIQLYNLILDTPGFHFSKCGMGNGIDFSLRREKAIAKIPKAMDTPEDLLFTSEEISQMINGIREADIAEAKRQEEFKREQEELLRRILKMK